MKRLLKIVILGAVMMAVNAAAFAQGVNFRASAPSVVAVGEMFQIQYSADAKVQKFTEPDMSGFNVIAGPSPSTSYSIVVNNANVEKKEQTAYTYVLRVDAEGQYTVPAAKITVDGTEYTSKPVVFEAVMEGSAAADAQGQQGVQQQDNGDIPPVTSIADDDIVIRMVADKSSAYKGEPIRVYLKLYSRVNIADYGEVKFPAFNGFWKHELNYRSQWQRETYNNKVYEAIILYDYLLYPQQSGVLQIDPFEMTVLAQIVTQNRRQSIFDDFFGGGPQIQDVRKRASSPALKIDVKDLPSGAPAGFNGAVGKFTMTTEMPPETISANSAVNMTVKINGTGNLSLIQAPNISIPASFEQYNIKATESLNMSATGITGYRQFEYPLIARAEGEYVIEPVQFSYFDPAAGRYMSLSSKEMRLTVMPDSSSMGVASGGLVSGLSKEDLRILGEDIHFIKIGSPKLMSKGNLFIGSLLYVLILFILFVLFIVALLYLQKRIKEMSNVEVVKGKRANKVALQRLKDAQKYMREDNQRKFYDEMLRALWGYMSDKLNIPVAILTKENVRETLTRKRVNPELTNKYIDIISECELAQYSPSASGQMQDIYRNALGTISKLESVIRR